MYATDQEKAALKVVGKGSEMVEGGVDSWQSSFAAAMITTGVVNMMSMGVEGLMT